MPKGQRAIFIVDDDASVRTALRRLLRPMNLPIRMFASAEHFLAEVKPAAGGCLVLDLRLPGMSGVQLQEEMLRREWKLPTVIVTAHDDPAARDAALRLGAISVLQKPFDHQQLLASVHAAAAQSEG
jgi:FixJ family two-component response regulator